MTHAGYLDLLSALADSPLPAEVRSALIPHLLVACPPGLPAGDCAAALAAPLLDLGLLEFQGEVPWVILDCGQWGEAEALPRRLAARLTAAAGLYPQFRGAAAVDLRPCGGAPLPGALAPLGRLLSALTGGVRALVLVDEAQLQAVGEALSGLDLLPLSLDADPALRLLEESGAALTNAGRQALEARLSQAGPALVRAVARQAVVAGAPLDAAQVLDCAAQYERPADHRAIGFERG